MENTLEKFNIIEEKIMRTLDLLEIAKSYCEHHFDKGEEIVALRSLLGIVIDKNKELVDLVDEMNLV